MEMTHGELLALVRRLLNPQGLSKDEQTAVADRLRQEARDPDLIDQILRLDAPLTPEEIVGLVATSRSRRLRVPSLN